MSIIEYFENNIGQNGFYFYKKHIPLPVMNENGKTNLVDPLSIHTQYFQLLMYWLRSLRKKKTYVNRQITDKHRQMLILDVTIDGSEYILINIYNANKGSEQLKVLNHVSYS